LNQTEPAICWKLIAKAWSDEEFKVRLLADPVVVLREAGMKVPEGVSVVILEDTHQTAHFVIPAKPSNAELCEQDLAKVIWGPSDGGHECVVCNMDE
jgi:hypothetical protein